MGFSSDEIQIHRRGFDFQLIYAALVSELQKTASYYLQIDTWRNVIIIWVQIKILVINENTKLQDK